jgi:GalNAc-alpha-(1->4)-GalNAc-alpha-(1->3)-diNAcBac-PP-undecaprenol alpha-1,4-N-acetyl-D-galactosaminyltransferase
MERVLAELIRYFSERPNLDLHLVLIGHNRDVYYPVPAKVKIYRPEFSFNKNLRLWSTIKTCIFLRGKIKTIKPDVVLSFGEYWNNFVLLALLGLKIRVYVSDRSSPLKNLGQLQSFLRKVLYPTAYGLIAQTEYAAEIARNERRNKNIKVIGNPIRDMSVQPATPRENIVLTVGRLIKTKNIDRLIKSFVDINLSNWRLYIVGGDALGQTQIKMLKNLVNELNAEESVIFAGFQKEIEAFYLKSRIFAFTSSSEGFPNVIGEALASGLPVVSYDCISGPSEMIEDGLNGFLVPVFNDKLFQEKLKLLMVNESLRDAMSTNATNSIKRFNTNTIGEEYFAFLSDSLRGRTN